ncbi:MAG: translocation/assembly module TamB domain-containing protein [Alphaproteobacteria bacterium]|nr:translocation/assembly module TamB domain-containing protein [Alphaproteobacteria bacterium]
MTTIRSMSVLARLSDAARRHPFISAAVALLMLLCLTLAAAYAALQTETGRAWLASYIGSALSQPGKFEIAIGRIDGRLPAEIRIDELTVGDSAGTWLTVRRFSLDWSPLALFRGRLQIESAGAGEIAVARRPITDDAGKDGGMPGMPPLDITVKRLTVDALRLEEPFLGMPASLRAAAELAVGTDAVHVKLDIVRTDAVAGHANAVIGYDPATGSLDLHAELSEPRGGLTARLLNLRQLPAIELSLAGEGTAADWRGTVTLDAEELASLKSSAVVSIGGPEARLALEGTARPGTDAGADAIAVFGPETDFAVALARPQGADKLILTVGRLRSAALDAGGTAELQLPDGEIDGRIHIATRDAARIAPLVAPLKLAAATADGRLRGPMGYPAIELDAVIDGPEIGAWSAKRMALHAGLRPDRPIGDAATVDIDGRATLTEFHGPLNELNTALGNSVEITLTRGALQGYRQLNIGGATVAGSKIRGSLAGGIAIDTGRIAARGTVEIDDLAPLSARAKRAVQGRLQSTYTLSHIPDDKLSIRLDGAVHDGRFDLPVAETLLGAAAEFTCRIDRAGDGGWAISDISLAGAGMTATGRLSIPPGAARISADYGIKVTNLAALGLTDPARPAGYLEVRGTAEGPMATPAIRGMASLVDAAPGGFAMERLTARYTMPDPARELKGALEIDGKNDLLPDLAGGIDFAIDKKTVRLAPLRLTARGTKVNGDLAIPLSGPPLSGTLTAEADDIGAWSPVAGTPLAGKLRADLVLSADDTRQGIALTGSVKAFALDSTVVSRDLSVSGNVSDALGVPRLALSLISGAGRVGPVQLDTLAVDLGGPFSGLNVALRASGDFRGPARLEASGTVQRADQRTLLTIAKLTGEVMGAPVALRKPAVADIGPGSEAMDIDLAFGDGTVLASLRRTPKDVSITAAARLIPLVLIWPNIPPQADEAKISVDVDLSGLLAEPGGSFKLSVTGLAAGESEASPQGLTLNIDGRLRDRLAVVTGRFTGVGEISAEIDATVPLQLSLSPVVVGVDRAALVSGRAVFKGPIEPVVALAGLDRHRLEGNADVLVTLSGTLLDPRIEGRADLTAGRYENLDTGTILADMRLKAHHANNVITIDEATASDGGEGRITLTGDIAFGGTEPIALALDAVFDRARLLRRDELTAVSSGKITLRGNATNRVIAGRLDVEEAAIRLTGGTAARVVQIEVEETGTPPAGVPPPRPAPKPSNTDLDLVISMPKRVFVRGRGLESEWGGELLVSGTTGAPRIQGKLQPLRGRYDFLGKIFTLRQGGIDFVGGEDIDPALDLSAERRVTDLTAIIRVTGTARSPVVKLESIPELPQDEVLSRILFDKSTGRLSAMEAVQLGQAAATMTGATEGGGIVDFSRKMLSLDVLEFKSTETTTDGTGTGAAQTSVEAGKYITDKVYIGVEGGATGEAGATVEIEVTPRVRIEGDVGQKEKESIGVKWKWDY